MALSINDRLPTEIINHIFSAGCEEKEITFGTTYSKPRRLKAFALRMSQVCRQWRALAHAPVNFHFWFVYLFLDATNGLSQSDLCQSMARNEDILLKSKLSDVDVFYKSRPQIDQERLFTYAIVRLVRYKNQLRSFSIISRPLESVILALNHLERCNRLVTLALYWSEESETLLEHPDDTLIWSSKQSRGIDLSFIGDLRELSISPDTLALKIPFPASIVSLDITGGVPRPDKVEWRHLMDMLRCLPFLISFRFQRIIVHGKPLAHQDPTVPLSLVLKSLRTMIFCIDPQTIFFMLNTLSIPFLTTLSLDFDLPWPVSEKDQGPVHPQQRLPHLSHLTLQLGSSSSIAALDHLVSAILPSSIETVKIVAGSPFTWYPDFPLHDLLPRVAHLSLHYQRGTSDLWIPILARWRAKNIYLHFRDPTFPMSSTLERSWSLQTDDRVILLCSELVVIFLENLHPEDFCMLMRCRIGGRALENVTLSYKPPYRLQDCIPAVSPVYEEEYALVTALGFQVSQPAQAFNFHEWLQLFPKIAELRLELLQIPPYLKNVQWKEAWWIRCFLVLCDPSAVAELRQLEIYVAFAVWHRFVFLDDGFDYDYNETIDKIEKIIWDSIFTVLDTRSRAATNNRKILVRLFSGGPGDPRLLRESTW
jgi:hypothetical protein